MCDALRELFADELKEQKKEGIRFECADKVA